MARPGLGPFALADALEVGRDDNGDAEIELDPVPVRVVIAAGSGGDETGWG
jgi:hypothetical protein